MWEVIAQNKRKTAVVLFLLSVLFLAFGTMCGVYLFGIENNGIAIPQILIIDAVFLIALIIMILQAKSIAFSTFDNGNLYKCEGKYGDKLTNIVKEMQIASGLPVMPDVYIMDTDMMNAFACAPNINNSAIVVTRGLIEALNRDELQGVIAHEISHIVNRDTAFLLYAGVIVTIISSISYGFLRGELRSSRRSRKSSSSGNAEAVIFLLMLLFVILAPILSKALFFLLSRKREYLADASAARYTRYPAGLASALMKISKNAGEYDPDALKIQGLEPKINPFVNASCIIPLGLKTEGDGIFSTHPSTSNRIKILSEMAGFNGAFDFGAYNKAYSKVTKKGSLFSPKSLKTASMGLVPINNIQTEKKEPEAQNSIEKHREVEDLMWHLAEYIFIECSCGTKLKIPKSYEGSKIPCPHCGKIHDTSNQTKCN